MGVGSVCVESLYSTGVIHRVFDQIPNLQNCFTTPNKNLEGEGASDRLNTFRQIPLQVDFWEKMTFRVWCLLSYFVNGCTPQGWGNSCYLEHCRPEIQLSKRPGDQIAYISVDSVGYNDVVIVIYILWDVKNYIYATHLNNLENDMII